MHDDKDGKDWKAIAALVPGRTKIQCTSRWHMVLEHGIDKATRRTGAWTTAEDLKLRYAVYIHSGKNWDAVTALVPGRTKGQCWSRWNKPLNPIFGRRVGYPGDWTEDEDL
jgi:myb proto-oncogene protein